MSRFHPTRRQEEPERGAHTLDVVDGTIVGLHGADVFVELGPRKQGVIPLAAFETEPRLGEVHQFTLRGREDELWMLNLHSERTLSEWEELEAGSLTTARVLTKTHDGYQLKIGPVYAYMPYSRSGVRKPRERGALLGRSIVVEVLEVDADKQRAIVSRKAVLKLQKAGAAPGAVVPGQTVQGRVTRIEPYGVFIRLSRGREGLCHVTNLSADRVEHPGDVVQIGEVVDARVLYVRAGGRRIGLGFKQLLESPWVRLEREHWEGQIVSVEIVRVGRYGAVGRLFAGAEGILPMSECGDRCPPAGLSTGDRLSARILEMDPEEERLAFSLLHATGQPIAADEAECIADFGTIRSLPALKDLLPEPGADGTPSSGFSTSLGAVLRQALKGAPEEQ
ncbi:MAG: S1 RNA-binding domain-containing protein [Planctomycetota bacterium]|nr:S1 RNA-binding domain-containing protein [Planctomycetota bacterium]MDG1985785.1 S1 RNA-binding domain-containing protein [Planctomycetota bacterium]